mmetsp:Transcript_14395/g.17363  ORF Transcript_14395/g.17363 Transcript_14395/m.17363 type:complete len:182 (-) Transcript_14395:111-656(-)
MRFFSTAFHIALIVSLVSCSDSFSVPQPNGNSDAPQPPTNLVDRGTFIEAVEILKAELAKASGMEVDEQPKEDPSSYTYGIGKLKVGLPLEHASGLGLAEAKLVLVNGMTEQVAELGIQTGDTIVAVSAADDAFLESTKELDLEGTAKIFMAAVEYCMKNGAPEIELELNRLVKLNYADES